MVKDGSLMKNKTCVWVNTSKSDSYTCSWIRVKYKYTYVKGIGLQRLSLISEERDWRD